MFSKQSSSLCLQAFHKMNSQDEASPAGDTVGHLLCRGGRWWIVVLLYTVLCFSDSRAHLLICPCTVLMPQAPHWVPKM